MGSQAAAAADIKAGTSRLGANEISACFSRAAAWPAQAASPAAAAFDSLPRLKSAGQDAGGRQLFCLQPDVVVAASKQLIDSVAAGSGTAECLGEIPAVCASGGADSSGGSSLCDKASDMVQRCFESTLCQALKHGLAEATYLRMY